VSPWRSVAVAAMVLGVVGCVSQAHSASAPASPASATLTPAERCQASVGVLLSAALAAIERGYTDGLDMVAVEQRYGADSAVYRTFAGAAEGAMIGHIDERGTVGALASVGRPVRNECAYYTANGMTP
jgi:hypothetical protein